MTDETNDEAVELAKQSDAAIEPADGSDGSEGGLSRRDVVTIGAITAGTLAVPFALNEIGDKPLTQRPNDEYSADIVIIGTGFAGIFAAVEAHKAGKSVVMVDKGAVGWSGLSPWASDSRPYDVELYGPEGSEGWEEWVLNTSKNTEYVNDRKWLDIFMKESMNIFFQLRAMGTHDCRPFERSKVWGKLLQDMNIPVIERTMVTSFLKDAKGAVKGCLGFTFDDSEHEPKAVVFKGKAVIMCTGAGAYKSPGFPNWGLTFDGDAMAYDVGAMITGKEYHDTHSTFANYPAASYDGWVWAQTVTGAYLMVGPPDPVSGGLTINSAVRVSTGGVGREVGGGPGGESASEFVAENPERVRNRARYAGKGILNLPDLTIDWGGPPEGANNPALGFRVGGATAGMGVHKGEGVWNSDYSCKADGVEGLWAAGDALGSQLCGSSYPGRGFSSYGSAIQGQMAARDCAAWVDSQPEPVLDPAYLSEKIEQMWAPREVARGFSPDWVTSTLQNLMTPYHILYVKEHKRLEGALASIEYMRKEMVPRMIARDGHELRLAHETANMLLNAEMKLRAGLYRTESRGTHFREDFPARDDENWLVWIMLKKGENGEMTLSKVPVPPEWGPDPSESYREQYPRAYPGEDAYLARKA